MNDNIIELEEYKRLLELKQQLDNNIITPEEISLEDKDALNNLYLKEISYLEKDIKRLRRINMELKIRKGEI